MVSYREWSHHLVGNVVRVCCVVYGSRTVIEHLLNGSDVASTTGFENSGRDRNNVDIFYVELPASLSSTGGHVPDVACQPAREGDSNQNPTTVGLPSPA